MNPAQACYLLQYLRNYIFVWLFRKQFYGFEHIGVATTRRFEIEHAPLWSRLAYIAQQDIHQVHHKEREIGRIGDRRACHVHEIFQPPVLFSIAEGEFDLESQAVIVDEFVGGQRQIATEQDDMPVLVRAVINLLDDDHIQWLRKLLVQQRRLGLLRGSSGFAGRFFRIRAHDLFQADGKGSPFGRTHQGQAEKANPGTGCWYTLEKKRSTPKVCLPALVKT